MLRRTFFQSALAPIVGSLWRKAPPPEYLKELTWMMQAARVPGLAIGCLNDGKLAWIECLGVREAGTTDAVSSSSLFHAASLSKQVTAHAAFALRAQRKLDFDKPLIEYVDDLPHADARKVTARHILSHSSGFPNWRYVEGSRPAPDLIPAFPPGSKYRYSGEGYFYLQRVMENVSGKGFEELVRELVFEPLSMASSTFIWNPESQERMAWPHNREGVVAKNRNGGSVGLRKMAAAAGKSVAELRYADYVPVLVPEGMAVLPNNLVPNAAASLVTSADDYGRFLAAAIRNLEIGQQQVAINEHLCWGLGWAMERVAGHTYLWQWGDNPGYKNFVLAEPSTGGALFVFTNGDGGARVYDRVVTKATGHEHPALLWL